MGVATAVRTCGHVGEDSVKMLHALLLWSRFCCCRFGSEAGFVPQGCINFIFSRAGNRFSRPCCSEIVLPALRSRPPPMPAAKWCANTWQALMGSI